MQLCTYVDLQYAYNDACLFTQLCIVSKAPVSVLLFAAVSTCTTFYITYFILWMTALIDFTASNILLLNALLEYFISLLITSL